MTHRHEAEVGVARRRGRDVGVVGGHCSSVPRKRLAICRLVSSRNQSPVSLMCGCVVYDPQDGLLLRLGARTAGGATHEVHIFMPCPIW